MKYFEAVKMASHGRGRGGFYGISEHTVDAKHPVRQPFDIPAYDSFISYRVQMDGEDEIRFPSTGILIIPEVFQRGFQITAMSATAATIASL